MFEHSKIASRVCEGHIFKIIKNTTLKKGTSIMKRFTDSPYFKMFTSRRMAVMVLLGFSSGLPLPLTGGTLQAWLTTAGVDIKTIGIFSLVGFPYTLKFLWSPFMDRFVPPWLGRRRGWIVPLQLLLLTGIALMALGSPQKMPLALAVIALIVAFISASQDIVVDAYRTDVLPDVERGFGAATFVFGYRMAMLVAGALALIMSDQNRMAEYILHDGYFYDNRGMWNLHRSRARSQSSPTQNHGRSDLGAFKGIFFKKIGIVIYPSYDPL